MERTEDIVRGEDEKIESTNDESSIISRKHLISPKDNLRGGIENPAMKVGYEASENGVKIVLNVENTHKSVIQSENGVGNIKVGANANELNRSDKLAEKSTKEHIKKTNDMESEGYYRKENDGRSENAENVGRLNGSVTIHTSNVSKNNCVTPKGNCIDDSDFLNQYGSGEKWRILRNVVCISMAFMIHFTAFVGATNLQSSINAAEGLGTVSLAAVYATLIISTVFLPAVLIKWVGCKGALIVSFISYMPYIGAQFYATYYTVTPAAVLVGLGGGPFWCAQCMYLCVVADVYARLTATSTEVIVVRFFGIFYMIYEFGQLFGNLVSSLVLSVGLEDTYSNTSVIDDVRDICGANFCPGNEALANPNLERPSDSKIYTIAGIYLGCMLLSVIVLVFGLDSLSRYNEAGLAAKDPPVTGVQLLKTAGRLLKQREQIFLLPLTVWLGLEKAVIAADYTASYVSCAWGIRNIGYVMICYGVANSASALLGGCIVKLTGRPPVIISAMVVHIGILITLLLWKPHPTDVLIFFVMSGLWGAADGVWNVQVNALCGILSPGNEKAAYSLFRLWESVGYILAYGYSSELCTDVKLYIVLGLLLLGMAGYGGIEIELRTKSKPSL